MKLCAVSFVGFARSLLRWKCSGRRISDRSKEAAAATAHAHENEIETLRKEHKSVVARMQDVNESAARTANEALAASNAETAKWRAMYDKRESRPEDLRRIKELQNDLHETATRLERSVAHRRTLQSELMGRAAELIRQRSWQPPLCRAAYALVAEGCYDSTI